MIEPAAAGLESLLVFSEGEVNQGYPLAVYRPDEFLAGRSVRVILVSKIENSFLGCVPQAAWDRLVAKRVLPRTFLTKAVRVLVKHCCEDDRSTIGDSDSVVWLGFIAGDMESFIEPSDLEDDTVEVDFGEDQLPFADALVQVAQDHFVFFSAEEGANEPKEPEPGSVDLAERVHHMEIMIQNLSAHIAALVPTTPKVTFSEPAPTAPAKSLPKPKTKQVPTRQDAGGEEEKYPDLDPGVVAAAVQAGIEPAALEEMQALMMKNPKGVKALKKAKTAPLGNDPLSENEEVEPEGHGSPSGSSDPVAAALTKLTVIVGEIRSDKRKKPGSSKLETALDGAMVGHGGESSSSLGGKKSAVARRILRSTLQDAPEEVYGLIERLMAEDILSHTLQPGLDLPSFSARGWVEHRSKIGPFKTVAHSAWGVSGILDQLRKGNSAAARARCCLLLLQLDQSCVDRGNWSLASDLSLEALPPFSSLAQHQPPSTQDGDLPFSKLLDPRWAELTLNYLRDQDDYLVRRRNLGRKAQADQEEPGPASPKRAQRLPSTKQKPRPPLRRPTVSEPLF